MKAAAGFKAAKGSDHAHRWQSFLTFLAKSFAKTNPHPLSSTVEHTLADIFGPRNTAPALQLYTQIIISNSPGLHTAGHTGTTGTISLRH